MGKLVKMPRTAPLPKIPTRDKRSREHLFPTEVMAMVSAAKKVGRHGFRDSTLILMAYRHGLRVSELVALRWEQIDFANGTIYTLWGGQKRARPVVSRSPDFLQINLS